MPIFMAACSPSIHATIVVSVAIVKGHRPLQRAAGEGMSDIGLDLSGVTGLLTLAVIDFGLLTATFVLLLRAVRVEPKPGAKAVPWRARSECRQALGAAVSAVVSIAFTAGMGWMVKAVLSKPALAQFDYLAWTWVFAVIAVWWMTVRKAAWAPQSKERAAVQPRPRRAPEPEKRPVKKVKQQKDGRHQIRGSRPPP
jgi:hypothetical protein